MICFDLSFDFNLPYIHSLTTSNFLRLRPSFLTGMDMISLEGKTNFFEKRVAEYQKSGVMASLASSERGKKAAAGTDLNFDADF